MLRLIFVVYCVTVGVIFIFAPWTLGWDRLVAQLPLQNLLFLDHPWVRGLVSGFGLVHLVWGIHDLNELLRPEHETQARRTTHRDAPQDPPTPGHQ